RCSASRGRGPSGRRARGRTCSTSVARSKARLQPAEAALDRKEVAFARAGAGSLAIITRAQEVIWEVFSNPNVPPGLRFRAASAILAERERPDPLRDLTRGGPGGRYLAGG